MLKLKLQHFGYFMWRADLLEKTLMLGKTEGREKGTTEDEMVGWHHWLVGQEFKQTPGVGDGQGGCSPWGRRVGHDWATELNWWHKLYFLVSTAWEHTQKDVKTPYTCNGILEVQPVELRARVLSHFSCVTLWTVACQAPLSMGISPRILKEIADLIQGIFLTQGWNRCLLCLLYCRQILYCWATREAPRSTLPSI